MKFFSLLIFGSVFVSFTSSMTPKRGPVIDPTFLSSIFGTPSTTTSRYEPTTKGLEEIIVSHTGSSSTQVDKNGKPCRCVPYYLCDSDYNENDNPDISGTNKMDIRFADSNEITCQESIERCCTKPNLSKPVPTSNPSKLNGCGYRNPDGLGVFFKGANSQYGEFPWVIALMDSRDETYLGVGVLINPGVVMTAAHVIYNYTNAPGNLKIRAGEWDTQTEKEIYGHEERVVREIHIHSDFRRGNLQNDIALLRLEWPLELKEHINVICMPEQSEVFDSHKNCIANGWGKTYFNLKDRFAVILKKVELDIVPHNLCSTMLKKTRLGRYFKLHSSFLCAGGDEGKDTCQGDGGGPLVCPLGNNRYKLTGLVSWGVGCGMKNVPGVYTNVALFREWVDKKLEDWGLQKTLY